jgi:hypothetical protein
MLRLPWELEAAILGLHGVGFGCTGFSLTRTNLISIRSGSITLVCCH